jgi:parallel beta-helix repeat protein
VPWASLQPGDTVLIHWRSTPYKEKWVICRQGTAGAPITVRGVLGPAGQRPVIDGQNAVTAPGVNYWSETRGVIKIGGANTPPDLMPRYIVIENLEVINASLPFSFTDDVGSSQRYSGNASGIYLEKGENITVRNCIFRENGNGFFVASSDGAVSRNILVQGNQIYNNGNSGSIFEHNSYTAAIDIVFEYNRYGPLRSGAGGNGLKDRSAGLVVRYNWIEGGNRQLDLVDGEDSSTIRNDPKYRETHVYGNVLIEPAGDGNRQIVHYGGDSGGSSSYRKGTLYFYNNTIVSTRTDRNTLFRLSTDDEHCDARNNIFYTTLPGSDLSILDQDGVIDLSHNWIKPGWVASFSSGPIFVNSDGTMVQGSSPGFVNEPGQDFHLAAGSAAINAGGNLNPAVLAAHNVLLQYVKHQSSEGRPSDGVFDIGAFENGAPPPPGNDPPTAVISANPTSGTEPLNVMFDGGGSSDTDGSIVSYAWNFGDGGNGSGMSASHTYASAGTFSAVLTVTDDDGAIGTGSVQINVTRDVFDSPVLSGSVSGSTVNLSWIHSGGASGFQIERGVKSKGSTNWSVIASVAGNVNSFQNQPGNGTFRYRVRAFRGSPVEYSGYSNEVSLRVR